ncbi:MAG: hypothetical protein AB7F78_24540 [Hyphomicrobiaceae bacterium]
MAGRGISLAAFGVSTIVMPAAAGLATDGFSGFASASFLRRAG